MSESLKKLSPTELLVNEFLQKAKNFQTNVELIKVLKSRTYKIAEANVLILQLLKEIEDISSD